MLLIPAIDLLGARVVRLTRGDYTTAEVYSEDPVSVARRFEEQGATHLHVVDLDGARDGRPGNLSVIEAIVASTELSVQVGGGVRDHAAARRWLDIGASVVLGTAAVSDPALLRDLCTTDGSRVLVALDARGGRVAIEGWARTSEVRVEELAPQVQAWGAGAILYTNIARDGTGDGPDVEGTARLQRALDVPVIASGGVGSLDHLAALRDAGVRRVVCGRALYVGRFTLPEALAVAAGR